MRLEDHRSGRRLRSSFTFEVLVWVSPTLINLMSPTEEHLLGSLFVTPVYSKSVFQEVAFPATHSAVPSFQLQLLLGMSLSSSCSKEPGASARCFADSTAFARLDWAQLLGPDYFKINHFWLQPAKSLTYRDVFLLSEPKVFTVSIYRECHHLGINYRSSGNRVIPPVRFPLTRVGA